MNRIKIELKWAIIFTIFTLVWWLLEKTLGWHDEKIANHFWLTLLFFPFVIFMYILAIREKRRRHYDKKITWKQGFLSGLLLSVFAAALSPIAQYIAHNYITPEFFVNVIESSVTNNFMSIEAANEYFNLTGYMYRSIISCIVGGTIVSAFVAFVLKRKSVKVKTT